MIILETSRFRNLKPVFPRVLFSLIWSYSQWFLCKTPWKSCLLIYLPLFIFHSQLNSFQFFFSSLKTALLLYNSHTINLLFISVQFHVFFKYIHKIVQLSQLFDSRIYSSSPKEILCQLGVTPVNLLPVSWTCLFWTFQICGILHYLAFYVWLVSLSISHIA